MWLAAMRCRQIILLCVGWKAQGEVALSPALWLHQVSDEGTAAVRKDKWLLAEKAGDSRKNQLWNMNLVLTRLKYKYCIIMA